MVSVRVIMFISWFRSDIGMKLVSVTWVYGRIPGLSWLFSKLSILFKDVYYVTHCTPMKKHHNFHTKKTASTPLIFPHITHQRCRRRGPVATCLRNYGLDGCGRSLWGSPFGRAPLWMVHSWRLTAGTCPHGGLVQIIFLSKLVICRFQPLIFQGVLLMATRNPVNSPVEGNGSWSPIIYKVL